jgi:transposase
VPAGSAIRSDRIGHLPKRLSNNRPNPFQDAVREVRVATETGKMLRILSNDLDATADEIAALYKRRWAIELFFGWVKQTLKITRFLGTSDNAVRTQIAVALIAFLLLRLAQAAQKAISSPLRFARLVRVNLMHRRRLDRLLQTEPTPPFNPAQLALQSNLNRTAVALTRPSTSLCRRKIKDVDGRVKPGQKGVGVLRRLAR